MKYAFFLVLVGIASGQFQPQSDGFRDFDNQRNNQPQQPTNFNNQPQPSPFDRPQPTNFNNQPQPSPFDRPQSNNFNTQPTNFNNRPTPRPATPYINNNPNRYNQNNPNAQNEAQATIVKQYFDETNLDGNRGGDNVYNRGYNWGFQTSNGFERQERIYFKNAGDLGQVLVKEGFYTYYDYEGKLIKVTYRADENGFQVFENNQLP